MGAEVGLNPAFLCFAGGDNGFCSAEAEALDGANKSFLPTVICAADWVVTALRNPVDVLTPKSSPPEARLPGTMHPDFVSGAKLFDTCPGAE